MRGRVGLAIALRLFIAVVAVPMLLIIAAREANAQAVDDSTLFVPDSVFTAGPASPVVYQSQYTRDQARGVWDQNVSYGRALKRFAISVNGNTSAAEDFARFGSRSTTGNMSGSVDWRATDSWVWTMAGQYSMSSITDGLRSSSSEQRRNQLRLQSQYRFPKFAGADFTILGSSEYQHNYDLRSAERLQLAADPDTIDTNIVERDSSYFSGRQDALRGQLNWAIRKGLDFKGTASGSRISPITKVRQYRASHPLDDSPGTASDTDTLIDLPADNASMEGTLTFSGLKGITVALNSSRRGNDQVYFDIGQLQVEQSSNDTRRHSLNVQSIMFSNRVTIQGTGTLSRTLREYVVRSNFNALLTTREITGGITYNTPKTQLFTNATVNRTVAERQSTGNGEIITRVATSNFTQRLGGRLWLVGLGSATLSSSRYVTPVDDRDVAGAFGSVGMRFSITPHCSTTANFSVSRSHQVSIDATRSGGNFATTTYQLNGGLRLPMSYNLAVAQDYIITATYRSFDFDDSRDDLYRQFRIDTSVADTVLPWAYFKLDHRYSFFDRGDFTAIEIGGPQLYGVQQKQYQQTLEGTMGIRPLPGILLIAKQSLADTQDKDVVHNGRRTAQQWNLSLGLEVNRSFWDGAGLTGAIRRETKYQNLSTQATSTSEEEHWLAAISFQKYFF